MRNDIDLATVPPVGNWTTLAGIWITFLLYEFGETEYVTISLLQLTFCFLVSKAETRLNHRILQPKVKLQRSSGPVLSFLQLMKLRPRRWDVLSYNKNVCRSPRARVGLSVPMTYHQIVPSAKERKENLPPNNKKQKHNI